VPLPPVNFFLERQAVKYDGFLTPPTTGDYQLSLTGWGDATLSVDGSAVIDMTGQDSRRVVDSPVLQLIAGHSYAVHIEYQATRPLTSLQPGTLLLQWRTPAAVQLPGITQAVAAARDADVAIVYVRDFETEERDRVSLKLPQSADQLISAVSAANPHTVVVLASGGPVTMPWLGSVGAVVQTYFGGQEQGRALADVLWGDVTPQGKLTVTFPTSEQATPPGRRTRGRASPAQTSPTAKALILATRATTLLASVRCSHSDMASRTQRLDTASSGCTRRIRTPPGYRKYSRVPGHQYRPAHRH
jgi:beta-glucosidase